MTTERTDEPTDTPADGTLTPPQAPSTQSGPSETAAVAGRDPDTIDAAAPESGAGARTPPDAAAAIFEPVPLQPEGAGPTGPSRLIVLAGYVAAAIIGGAILFVGLASTGSIAGFRASPSPSPAVQDPAALGDPGAPVTIEVWADYQCPYCGLQSRGVEPSIERALVETGRARLVYRDFAFLGQESIDAAVAARCAGRQDAYWYFHDLLFGSQQGENQGAFARATLQGLAGFAGLDAAAFTGCLDDPTVAAAVRAQTETGRGLGVQSTPTLRISGPGGAELLTGVRPLAQIVATVDRLARPAPSGAAASGSPITSGSPVASGSAPSSSQDTVSGSPSPSPVSGPTSTP